MSTIFESYFACIIPTSTVNSVGIENLRKYFSMSEKFNDEEAYFRLKKVIYAGGGKSTYKHISLHNKKKQKKLHNNRTKIRK